MLKWWTSLFEQDTPDDPATGQHYSLLACKILCLIYMRSTAFNINMNAVEIFSISLWN